MFNHMLRSVFQEQHWAKISILKLEGLMENFLDGRSLSWVISEKSTENKTHAAKE